MSVVEVKLHPAVQYLNTLFLPTDLLCFTFIHSTKTYASGAAVTENCFWQLSDAITDDAIANLIQKNNDHHVYVSMAPFKSDSRNRTKANIVEARHVFIEVDENGDAVLAAVRASVDEGEIPAPTVIVQSSPHKYQFIWNVDGLTIPQQEALNRTLQQKFGTDPQATDAARVLRIPGFKNLKPKYGDPKPVVEIIEFNEPPFLGNTIRSFAIPLTSKPDDTVYPPASDAAVQESIELLEAAMNAASVSYNRKVWEGSGGAYKFILATCPWREKHTNGAPSDAMAIVQPTGAYGFNCLHANCADKHWDDFRAHLESLVGHSLSFRRHENNKPTEDACADSGGSPPAAGQNPTETAPLSPIVRPPIPEAAFYGLIGAITKKLDPCTEAHPMGILIELLVAFGNLIGRCAYIQIEDTKHFTNEFMVKVGETSRARKGTGRNRVNALMQQVDPYWVLNRHISGIGSGEIVVHQIRDPRTVYEVDKKTYTTKETVIPGVADKRLLVNVGEFQGILAICHRPDTTLSVVLRNGWDSLPMANLVKTDPAKCQEPHLSLDADTTAAELSAQLSQTEKNNGFANRILWVCVWRNRELALGGPDMDWSAEVPQLREAAEFARGIHRVYLDEPARKMWTRTMYPKLERDIPGVIGAVTGRASAHTLRIALIFALLDKDNYIRVAHLDAAAAVWQYCEDSVYAIFGDMVSPNQRQLLDFLATSGDATKTQIIRDCFGGHRTAKAIDYDLEVLKSQDRVREKIVDGVTYWNKLGKAKTVGN